MALSAYVETLKLYRNMNNNMIYDINMVAKHKDITAITNNESLGEI